MTNLVTNGQLSYTPKRQAPSLPGLMPIEWSRFYGSDLKVDSALGQGWVLPWEQSLRSYNGFVYLTDDQGRTVSFVALKP